MTLLARSRNRARQEEQVARIVSAAASASNEPHPLRSSNVWCDPFLERTMICIIFVCLLSVVLFQIYPFDMASC